MAGSKENVSAYRANASKTERRIRKTSADQKKDGKEIAKRISSAVFSFGRYRMGIACQIYQFF